MMGIGSDMAASLLLLGGQDYSIFADMARRAG